MKPGPSVSARAWVASMAFYALGAIAGLFFPLTVLPPVLQVVGVELLGVHAA